MNLYCGLDFAFAKNGLVVIDENSNIITKELIVTTVKQIDEERLVYVVESFEKYLLPHLESIKSVYIEGLSFGSKGQAVSQLGACHYLTRIFLYQNNFNYRVITPGQLKKFVTGKGQCKKDLILLNVYKKWGVEFDDDNIADAYSLARMSLFEDLKK